MNDRNEDDDCVWIDLHCARLAKVAWLNVPWFLAKGWDLSSSNDRNRLEKWVIEEFAVIIPSKETPPESFGLPTKLMAAERYGATGSSPHGGGGRSVISGEFSIKGVGVTPMVGVGADWNHSHGCLFLEEGLRETLFSELLITEIDGPIVPVIAVIDLGFSVDNISKEASVLSRRALCVRPWIKRFAHLERATFFKPAFSVGKDQVRDAARTRDAVIDFIGGQSSQCVLEKLSTSLSTASETIAHTHVHRLYHGGVSSGNLGLNGELLDFGSSRSVPSWSRKPFSQDGVCFGDELLRLRSIFISVMFYIRKYSALSFSSRQIEIVWHHALRKYSFAYGREVQRCLGEATFRNQSAARTASKEFFRKSQKSSRSATVFAECLVSEAAVLDSTGYGIGLSREVIQEAIKSWISAKHYSDNTIENDSFESEIREYLTSHRRFYRFFRSEDRFLFAQHQDSTLMIVSRGLNKAVKAILVGPIRNNSIFINERWHTFRRSYLSGQPKNGSVGAIEASARLTGKAVRVRLLETTLTFAYCCNDPL